MATTPGTHPLIYKSILLGTTFSPGTVTLSDYPRKHDWEDQKPKGTQGSVTVCHGQKNSGFTATFFLADLEDVEAWDEFAKLISSTVDGPKPKALPVYHPDLVRNRITDVVAAEIGTFVHDGKNGASITVKFIEFRPPKPKAAAKPASGGRVGTTTIDTAASRPDPNREAKRELDALTAQFNSP
jgi:hypothetical protein